MPLTLVTGPANAGKAQRVLDEVRARLDEDPVLVVPTFADVRRYRRELAGSGAVFGGSVLTFSGLAREIGRRAGYRGRPLGDVERERLVAVAVQRAGLDLLAASAATPGFARAAGGLIAELQRELVTPQRFTAALRRWGEEEPGRAAYTREVASLYAGYRGLLDELGLVDRELHAWRALDALRADREAWGRTPVLFYGFDELTRLERDAVETLLGCPGVRVTVALAYEPGRAAFAARAGTAHELQPLADETLALDARADHYAPASRAALHHLERGLFEDAPGRVDPGDALALLEAGGERAELELVAAEVLDLLARGVPAGEIVVAHRAPAACATLLEEVFEDYGIPVALAVARPLVATALGRGLLGLLRAALLGGSAADVLAWLRAPGVAEPHLADAVERAVRRAGALDAEAALGELRRRGFGTEPVERLREAAAAAPQRGAPATAGRSSAPQRSASGPGPLALLEAIGAVAGGLLAAPHRRAAAVLGPAERLDAAAAGAVRRAVEGLARLARRDPALAPDAPELERILSALEVRPPAPAEGAAVEVRHPLAIRARRVRALVVCGLQEGTFPAVPRPDPFLGEEERVAIARASGLVLPPRRQDVERERYLLYACVSRPEERLVLAWRTGDDDGGPAVPSLFVEDVRDLFEPDALERVTRRRGLGEQAWTLDAAPTERERARAEAAVGPRAAPEEIADLSHPDVLGALAARPTWSPAQLEDYAGCPVRWLVDRFLGPDDLEPDAEPLQRGGVAHGALEDALRALRERHGSARVTPENLDEARSLALAALERREREKPLSTRPARRRVLRRRLEADLGAYLGELAARGAVHEPERFEQGFGVEDGPGPLRLADDLALAGRIDRIDVRPGTDEAVVVDYKGAKAPALARWEAERRLQVGLYLLAAREVLGLRPVAGLYQPLGGDRRPRGVVLADGGVEGAVRTDVVDRETFDAVLDEVADRAREAAAQLRGGLLEPRPDRCHWKGGCAYPSVCRCEAR